MPSHNAKTLFDLNIESAEDLLALYDGIKSLGSRLDISWLLRASIVFAVSALDAYFHDKVKYRVGKVDLKHMPEPLAKFQIPLRELAKWESARRKRNVLRNWVTGHLSTRPLQRQEDISSALKLVGIDSVWAKIEPDTPKRDAMLEKMARIIRRRNQIAHEGDRESSRRSGKKLRGIKKPEVEDSIKFIKGLVKRIEKAFPR